MRQLSQWCSNVMLLLKGNVQHKGKFKETCLPAHPHLSHRAAYLLARCIVDHAHMNPMMRHIYMCKTLFALTNKLYIIGHA